MPIKLPTHVKTSLLVTASSEMVFYFEIHHIKSVLFIRSIGGWTLLGKILGMEVKYDLTRRTHVRKLTFVEFTLYIRVIFVNKRTRAV